jgi:signal transduction histidine kinase
MVTDASKVIPDCVQQLENEDWTAVLDAVAAADVWLRDAAPGHYAIDHVVTALGNLARHPKWEIRRAIAQIAGRSQHAGFEPGLIKLAADDNARVRQAAQHATVRRRDGRQASIYGRQHEDRINAILDDVEVRFGSLGRDAVKRAAALIANTFTREFYHEVIKLVTPLALSADGLQQRLTLDPTVTAGTRDEIARIERQVHHLRTVLDAMRSFTATPTLKFERESLREVAEEAARLVSPATGQTITPIDILISANLTAEVARSRLVQALTNVLTNAVEACAEVSAIQPIQIKGWEHEGHVGLSIEDFGCGMSREAAVDARSLFATSKAQGTGFGLPLAIKIVEDEHCGRLSITSSKGKGTRIEMLIPAERVGS